MYKRQIEDPDHERQLLAQRSSAREQRLVVNFLALSPRAQAYREGLEAKRVNARVHLRKILALAELHGKEAGARALDDGLELQALQRRIHRQHPCRAPARQPRARRPAAHAQSRPARTGDPRVNAGQEPRLFAGEVSVLILD